MGKPYLLLNRFQDACMGKYLSKSRHFSNPGGMAGLDSGVIWNVTEERVILPECPPCLRIDLMTYSLSQGDTFLRSFASLPSYRSAKNLVAHPVGTPPLLVMPAARL